MASEDGNVLFKSIFLYSENIFLKILNHKHIHIFQFLVHKNPIFSENSTSFLALLVENSAITLVYFLGGHIQ